jgi:threonine dehydrogenase-like Zn-dependent dehydrogenase
VAAEEVPAVRGFVVSATWDPRADYTPTADEQARRRAIDGTRVWRYPEVAVETVPDPAIEAADEVIVRSRAVGICGSDVHMYETDADGYILLPYRTRFPVTLGHEFAGEVVEVGKAVTRFKPGDPVAVEAMRYCGACFACKEGLFNFCTRCEDHGFTLDGGCADLVAVKERQCWSLDGLVEAFPGPALFDVGALIEPTSIAYNALFTRAGGPKPGDTAVVFGCGPVGLAAVHLLRAAGAGQIIAFDTLPERRALAVTMGADTALDPIDAGSSRSVAARAILDRTNGDGAQFLVEATGASNAVFPEIELAMGLVAKVVVIGIDAQPTAVNLWRFQSTGSRIYGSIGHLEGAFGATISLHERGRINMSAIVSKTFELKDAVEALKQQSRRGEGKILIKPS